MIISLRGTSGAGKSHTVRQIVGLYEKHRNIYEDGRRRPLYSLHGRSGGRTLVVPGHYEIANGGIDTLRSLDRAYEIADWGWIRRYDVLMEGKNMSDGVSLIEERHARGLDVRVVLIDTPLAECIASVRMRGHHIAEDSVARTQSKVIRDFEKFTCTKFRGSREDCLETVREWLKI